MAEEPEQKSASSVGDAEVYRAILSAQERFNYFFLAASASAVTFAVLRTEGQAPACWMIATGVAVALWGISFWFGSEHLLMKAEILLTDFRMRQVSTGNEPISAAHPELAGPALQRLNESAIKINAKARVYGRTQRYTFLAGALLYLVGHVQHLCVQ